MHRSVNCIIPWRGGIASPRGSISPIRYQTRTYTAHGAQNACAEYMQCIALPSFPLRVHPPMDGDSE